MVKLKRKIPQPTLPARTGAIPAAELPGDLMLLSFRYLDACAKFDFSHGAAQCGPKLLERLKALCGATIHELRLGGRSWRFHPIEFARTTERDGFASLPAAVRESPAWQFEVSQGAYGRVHGFLIGNVFYVVWLDPNHQLYPQ